MDRLERKETENDTRVGECGVCVCVCVDASMCISEALVSLHEFKGLKIKNEEKQAVYEQLT